MVRASARSRSASWAAASRVVDEASSASARRLAARSSASRTTRVAVSSAVACRSASRASAAAVRSSSSARASVSSASASALAEATSRLGLLARLRGLLREPLPLLVVCGPQLDEGLGPLLLRRLHERAGLVGRVGQQLARLLAGGRDLGPGGLEGPVGRLPLGLRVVVQPLRLLAQLARAGLRLLELAARLVVELVGDLLGVLQQCCGGRVQRWHAGGFDRSEGNPDWSPK